MATYIKTLKEDNGDITYPQTKAGAVYTNEGSDVQTVLDDCTRYEEVASTGSLAQTVPASIIDWSSYNAITVALAAPISTTTIGVISMSTILARTGTAFTSSSNGGIAIGAGVSKVKFSANVFMSSSTRPYGWCELYKNGASTGIEFIADLYSNSFGSVVLTPIILSVAEGDVFTIYNREANTGIRAGGATFFTAEQVE